MKRPAFSIDGPLPASGLPTRPPLRIAWQLEPGRPERSYCPLLSRLQGACLSRHAEDRSADQQQLVTPSENRDGPTKEPALASKGLFDRPASVRGLMLVACVDPARVDSRPMSCSCASLQMSKALDGTAAPSGW